MILGEHLLNVQIFTFVLYNGLHHTHSEESIVTFDIIEVNNKVGSVQIEMNNQFITMYNWLTHIFSTKTLIHESLPIIWWEDANVTSKC